MTTTAVQKITGLIERLLASREQRRSRPGEAVIVKAIESVLDLLEARAVGNPKVRDVVGRCREAVASMASDGPTRTISE